jgi:hypothetical protein
MAGCELPALLNFMIKYLFPVYFILGVISSGCSNQPNQNLAESTKTPEKKTMVSFIVDDNLATMSGQFQLLFINGNDSAVATNIGNEVVLPVLRKDTGYIIIFKYGNYTMRFSGITKKMIYSEREVEWKFGVDNRPFNNLVGLLSTDEFKEDKTTEQLQYLQFNPLEHREGIQFVNKITAQPDRIDSGNPLLYRPCIHMSDTFFEQVDSVKKKSLVSLFPLDFEGVSSSHIDSITQVSNTINVEKFGICNTYEIILSKELPSIMAKKMYLLFCKEQQKGVLFQIERLQPIKIKNSDKTILVAGTYLVKSKGYFLIYKFDKANGFGQIFNSLSDKYCNNETAVYNNSLDCLSYEPFMLEFKNADVNHDGLMDLIFSGKALLFCEGLETRYGRKERKPLKEEQLQIVFETVQNSDSLSWKLSDTDACKILDR